MGDGSADFGLGIRSTFSGLMSMWIIGLDDAPEMVEGRVCRE
jgi:hypothetical protein